MGYESDRKAWQVSPSLAAMRLPGGLLEGTTVLTGSGAIPVQNIPVGARVITRTGLARVTGVLSLPAEKQPLVRIRAGSSLIAQASRDLVVAASQRLYLRGRAAFTQVGRTEAMVAAGELADGLDVLRCCLPDAEDCRVYRLVFDEAEVIFAGGAELGIAAPVGRRRLVDA